MANLLVIGAGQLGSRHLQALAMYDAPAKVFVVDPSAASLATAKERYDSVCKESSPEAFFATSLDGLPSSIDVAIVATGADVRAKVVESLLSKVRVRYAVLEKVLFQRADDYKTIGKILDQKKCVAFVNCPRRMWPFYVAMKGDLVGRGPLSVSVKGRDIGLACNGIHFVDLVAYLSGENLTSVDGSELSVGAVPAKRPGFYEVQGILAARFAGGSTLTLESLASSPASHVIQVKAGGNAWEILEGSATVTSSGATQPFETPFQSQLTHLVINDLLRSSKCRLTSYDESRSLHQPFIASLMQHFRACSILKGDFCPIT